MGRTFQSAEGSQVGKDDYISKPISPDLFDEILNLFAEDAPGQINKIRDGLDDANMKDIKRAAHTLKGAAANIIAEGVRKAAEEIEHNADEGSLDGIGEKLKNLEEEVAKITCVIQEVTGA